MFESVSFPAKKRQRRRFVYIVVGDLKTPLLLPVFFAGSTYNTGMRQSNADEQVIDRCGVGDTCRHELIFQFGTPQQLALRPVALLQPTSTCFL